MWIDSIVLIVSIVSIGGAKLGRFALPRTHQHQKRFAVGLLRRPFFLRLEGKPDIKDDENRRIR
jgi:hypothetical protein